MIKRILRYIHRNNTLTLYKVDSYIFDGNGNPIGHKDLYIRLTDNITISDLENIMNNDFKNSNIDRRVKITNLQKL